jgi:glutamine synthetase
MFWFVAFSCLSCRHAHFSSMLARDYLLLLPFQFEVKLVDNMANIYLALAGILAAGLDGLSKNLTLRPSLGEETAAAAAAAAPTTTTTTIATSLPRTIEESLNLLQANDFLMNTVLPPALSRGYLAVRRDEARRAAKMTLEDEVREALDRA